MTGDPISDILSGRFRFGQSSEIVQCPIRSLMIEPSLDGSEADLIGRLGFASPTLVCDDNTYEALGSRIAASVSDTHLVVLSNPRADQATADALSDGTRHSENLVAIGAGTLNDLVKYVSHRRQRPYAVFATAPSMNGYVTTTASISRHGEKLSLPATPPLGAFFDLGILAKAPFRMIQAGVGDALCRSTAEIDWRLSHLLLDTPFDETPFAIQVRDEADLLGKLDGLRKGDVDAGMALVRLLVLGGLGMLMAGSSQPGSQGEHLISHCIDLALRPHPGSLHGEQVGLSTQTMASLQHAVLGASEPPVLDQARYNQEPSPRQLGPLKHLLPTALHGKALTGSRLEAVNERLNDRWPALRATYEERALPPTRLQAAFDAVGLARKPEDLGIDRAHYGECVLYARALRDRFTMLDVAAGSGLLEPFVEKYVLVDP